MSKLMRNQADLLSPQIQTLEALIQNLSGQLYDEWTLREQLSLAEVLGRTVVRLGELYRLQKQINLLAYAEQRARLTVSIEYAEQEEVLNQPSQAELQAQQAIQKKQQQRLRVARYLETSPDMVSEDMLLMAAAGTLQKY